MYYIFPESRKANRRQNAIIPDWKIYPRSQDHSTVYLKNVVTDPSIQVGDYTMYDDFEKDPRDFQRNNVLYHYPECNHDTLKIGKFCSIACGAKFIFNAANHALQSLSTYPFPIFFAEWGLPADTASIAQAWDNHGDITVGNDVPPYTIVGGLPAKAIRKRFDADTIARLEAIRWWDWDTAKIARNLAAIQSGNIDALEKAL